MPSNVNKKLSIHFCWVKRFFPQLASVAFIIFVRLILFFTHKPDKYSRCSNFLHYTPLILSRKSSLCIYILLLDPTRPDSCVSIFNLLDYLARSLFDFFMVTIKFNFARFTIFIQNNYYLSNLILRVPQSWLVWGDQLCAG